LLLTLQIEGFQLLGNPQLNFSTPKGKHTTRAFKMPIRLLTDYFAIRGGSRKKIAKKRIPRVPTSKNV